MNNKGSAKGGKVISTVVCLSPALITELDKKADAEGGFSRSAIIRRACLAYLNNDKAGQQAIKEERE